MVSKKLVKNLLRGFGVISIFGLTAAVAAEPIMERYGYALDAFYGSKRQEVVTEDTGEANWIYQSNFRNITEAVEKQKAFAIKEASETYVLLKNNNALPLKANPKVSFFGIRSYAPVYGSNMGTTPDLNVVDDGNTAMEAYADRGIQANPSLMNSYKALSRTSTGKKGTTTINAWDGTRFTSNWGSDLTQSLEVPFSELTPGYSADYATYKDAAIVTISRNGGEMSAYTVNETDSKTKNIFGLSQNEKAVIAEAKKVNGPLIVLVNSANPMELKELQEDEDIDAILWIGFPGSYGFYGVADVLVGNANPSGHLGDTFAANTVVNPAMVSFDTAGGSKWDEKGVNGNNYLINQEGIYSGYRYYETRYYDVINGVSGAASAKAGTYTNADTTKATVDGTWQYDNEVVYSFGYGLSYTTFKQTIDDVKISSNKKSAEVTVTVENTGSVAGKDVIELYAKAPYTDYDVKYGVEKSAVQLMDYEKTVELKAGKSQTITLKVDLANLASYDYTNAKTYTLANGEYYFAIGNGAHEAVNNILKAEGKDVSGDASKTYRWTWNDGTFGDTLTKVDNITFSVSKAGVEITNQVSDNNYSAMDINALVPGTATYLSRNNWNGTYPTLKTLSANASAVLKKALSSDYYEVHTNDDTSEYKWGVNAWDSTEGADNSNSIHFSEMAGAEWDDDRWDAFIDQLTIKEFIDFASKAMHNVEALPGIGYSGNASDDGPGGSDSYTLKDGVYQGTPYSEMNDPNYEKYSKYGTKVFPAPINLAYSWNKDLAYENGQIVLGETALVFQLPIMIGPGMNLHRHGYNARGFEYYSEDPILSGYTGSAVSQGAQSLGCMVNIKHFAFNDQENDRDGVAVFMNEQAARELELRNFQQALEGNGKPASMADDEKAYTVGALGVMTSFNRLGAIAVGANEGVMQNILRGEWDFKGYCVTDFSQVSVKAAPKESIQFGTTAFCGSGTRDNLDKLYWNAEAIAKDANLCAAVKLDLKYNLYALAQTSVMNGYNTSTHTVQLDTPWRQLYRGLQIGFGISTGLILAGWIALEVLDFVKNKKEEN